MPRHSVLVFVASVLTFVNSYHFPPVTWYEYGNKERIIARKTKADFSHLKIILLIVRGTSFLYSRSSYSFLGQLEPCLGWAFQNYGFSEHKML